jgi:uncharacterized protein (TIGR02246 family)
MIEAMTPTRSPSSAARLSTARAQAEIRALRQQHNEALAAFDLDRVTRLVTDDFVMILGGGHVLQGAAAYRDFVARSFADPHPVRFVRTPDRIDVGAPDDFAVAAETGHWVGIATDGSGARMAGRYLVHWTQQPGAWCIASETYVTVG